MGGEGDVVSVGGDGKGWTDKGSTTPLESLCGPAGFFEGPARLESVAVPEENERMQ